jgi:1-aminocyclopropane-1-carboxylate deaminase
MTPLHLIEEHPGTKDDIRLWIKRDDLIHPTIQGNKWRKLHRLVELWQQQGQQGVITLGGPFSNHLRAVAAAGAEYGFKTVGLVRGLAADLDNPSMRYVQAAGMSVHLISKATYNTLNAGDWSVVADILVAYPTDWVRLPEGGQHELAVAGCMDIGHEIAQQYDASRHTIVAVPAGTGTTAAGIVRTWTGAVWVFPAAPYGVDVARISLWAGMDVSDRCTMMDQRELGRFAAMKPELLAFIQEFEAKTSILLDPIYNGKMLYTLFQMLTARAVPPKTDIIALHTGGLGPT